MRLHWNVFFSAIGTGSISVAAVNLSWKNHGPKPQISTFFDVHLVSCRWNTLGALPLRLCRPVFASVRRETAGMLCTGGKYLSAAVLTLLL